MRRLLRIALTITLLATAGCGGTGRTHTPGPGAAASAVCGYWYAIGRTPTDKEIDALAPRMSVVVLNAWDLDAAKRIRAVNRTAKVLVYKDLSSTRDYAGAVVDGDDAALLPSGVGYAAANRMHPDWFATDQDGRRIEWGQFGRHWQMAVWNAAYQRAWTEAVAREVKANGWDGVLADNDLTRLGVYHPGRFAGTSNNADSDRLLRDGLADLITLAGERLAAEGAILVPNVADSIPGDARWGTHSRFGGGMDEFFGRVISGQAFTELRANQVDPGAGLTLLVTQARTSQERLTGFAAAALFSNSRTCWTVTTDGDYHSPLSSFYLDLPLGEPAADPAPLDTGVWQRRYTGGWVAVNTSGEPQTVVPPSGLTQIDGSPVDGALPLAPYTGAVLRKR